MAEKQLAKTGVVGYLRSPEVQKRIGELLDKRAGQFTTSLMSALNNTPHLSECTPPTVLSAAITAASMDLPINSNLGFAYLIPYKNKGIYEAQFQMGWKGFVQLAQRSGQYKTIAATEVYDGQLVDENPIKGNKYDWKNKSGEAIIGYVAYFELLNGFEKDLYMSVEEVETHAKRYSQSYRAGFGPWKDDFDLMANKTVLKQLISKFGPLSTEMQTAMEKDQAVINDDEIIDYIDNLSELEEQVSKASTAQELADILDELPVDTRKKLVKAAEKRLKELED